MLATDTETETEDDAKARKVTISTCHAAKGLEWPVVFVPACEDGTYPFFRSTGADEVDEERRLLYVAITRAKIFCTLSWSKVRMLGAETKQKLISPFLGPTSAKHPTLFHKTLDHIGVKQRKELAEILGRPAPDEESTAIMIQEHTASLPPEQPAYEYPNASQGGTGTYGQYSSGRYAGSGGGSQGQFSQSSSQGGSQWTSRASGPAPVPAGAGFQSALSTYKAPGVQTTTAGFAPVSSLANGRPKASVDRILAFSRPRPAVPSSQPAPTSSQATLSSTSTSSADLPPPKPSNASQPPVSNFFTSSAASTSIPAVAPYVANPLAPTPLPRTAPPSLAPQSLSRATPTTAPTSLSTAAPTTNTKAGPKPLRALASTERILSFSRPRPIAPPAENSAPSSSAGGTLKMPETRSSLINDAVLLNPVYKPRQDLLSTFQTNEAHNLSEIRNLASPPKGQAQSTEKGKGKGKAIVTIDLCSSSPSPEKVVAKPVEAEIAEKVAGEPVVLEVTGGRPKRQAAKRAAEGFPKKAAPATTKKARKNTPIPLIQPLQPGQPVTQAYINALLNPNILSTLPSNQINVYVPTEVRAVLKSHQWTQLHNMWNAVQAVRGRIYMERNFAPPENQKEAPVHLPSPQQDIASPASEDVVDAAPPTPEVLPTPQPTTAPREKEKEVPVHLPSPQQDDRSPEVEDVVGAALPTPQLLPAP
ncbi:hypothetical protein P7C70_g8944, partial [Phenoliferia sp. Uapishka_3]